MSASEDAPDDGPTEAELQALVDGMAEFADKTGETVRDVLAERPTSSKAVTLDDVGMTQEEMESIATDSKSWVPYQGPQGGEGWRNTESGEVVYSDDPPGEVTDDSVIGDEVVSGDDLSEAAGKADELTEVGNWKGENDEETFRAGSTAFFAAAKDPDLVEHIRGSNSAWLFGYENEDSAEIGSADTSGTGENMSWDMDINAAKAEPGEGFVQHEYGHITHGLAGYEMEAETSPDIPNPYDEEQLDQYELRRNEAVEPAVSGDEYDRFFEEVNEAFRETHREAREIRDDIPDDAEGTERFAGIGHLGENSMTNNAYSMKDAQELASDAIRAVTTGDEEMRRRLADNHPDLFDATTELFKEVPIDLDNPADGDPAVHDPEDEEAADLDTCIEENQDKDDPESYCAVALGFTDGDGEDEDEDEDEDETEQEADGPTFAHLSDVTVTRAEMNRIADADTPWTTVSVEGGVGWHNTDTGEVVYEKEDG